MRKIVYMISVILGVVTMTSATPLIEQWDTDTSGWLINNTLGGVAYGSLSWSSTLGHDGALQITGGAASGQPKMDVIYTTGGLATTPAYAPGDHILFDFYAAEAPTKLNVYFLGTGNHAWFLDVTSDVLAGGWASISAPVMFGAGWFNVDDGRETYSEWAADIVNLSQIGIMIEYLQGQGGQVYGLDNFDVIPEPGTYAMLGVALLSLALCFRSRLSVALAEIRTVVQG